MGQSSPLSSSARHIHFETTAIPSPALAQAITTRRRASFGIASNFASWRQNAGNVSLMVPLPQEISMRTMLATALCAFAVTANANAAVKEEPVTYKDGETAMKGFVVYDDAVQGKRPGIVMVHEWWGITKHIHSEAHKFAQQGYTAFIADMYGDAKTADNPKDAGALSGSVMKNPKEMEARFNAARDQLAKNPTVDPQRIGAVGYCFGGAVVLNMARAGADLAAVAGFHASLGLNTPAPAPGTVKAKLLVLNGADDPFVKREQYEVFKKDLDAAKADYRVVEYPGAVHAFTNPEATELGKKFNLPLRYDAKVDQEAKAEAAKFFAANLKK
jgi:dienelactone hydrolase